MSAVKKSKLLSESKQWSLIFARTLMDDFHEAMLGKLNDLADRAQANQQQYLLFEVITRLQKNRQDITENYQVALQRYFDKFARNDFANNNAAVFAGASNLALMAEEDVERDIAESALIKKVEVEHSETIYCLHKRLASLVAGNLAQEACPVGPKQLAQFFEQAIQCLQPEKKMRHLFYKVFEAALLARIGDFYVELNSRLEDAAVLPGVSRMKVHGGKQNRNDQSRNGPHQGNSNINNDNTMGVSNTAVAGNYTANSYAGSNHAVSSHTAGNYGGGSAYNQQSTGYHRRVELVSAIQHLQNVSDSSIRNAALGLQQVVPGNVPPCVIQPVETFVNAIDNSATKVQGQKIKTASGEVNTIDLVGKIFDYMLKDKNLPDAVKSLLSYLHVPYVKVALLDPKLFAHQSHPARQLLDKLSEAGASWLNKDGYGQFNVFGKIKEVVNQILSDNSNSVEMYCDLLQDFSIFVRKLEKRAEQIEKISIQQVEAEKKREDVKALVLQQIKARVDIDKVPSSVAALFMYPWFDYLTFVSLRYGENSSQWQQGLEFIDQLVWSVKPNANKADVEKLQQLQPKLHGLISKALEVISYDHSKGVLLLKKIDHLQKLVIAQAKAKTEAEAQVLAKKQMDVTRTQQNVSELNKIKQEIQERENQAVVISAGDISAREQAFIEQLKQVALGTWFEISLPDSYETKKVKLAWLNKQKQAYLFVNTSGKKELTLTAVEIARLMQAKSARVLAESPKPFFDRALEAAYKLTAQAL